MPFGASTQPAFLCLGGQLVEDLLATILFLPLVRHQILGADAPVGPNLARRNLPFLDQLDQVRARDIEKLGRLLGRELRMHGDNRDRVSVGHLAKDLQEELEGSARNDH